MPHPPLAARRIGGARSSPATGEHGFSEVFEHFLAGLLAHSRELSLLLAPNVNSYKRFVAGSFAPTALAWGHDNRTCAFRVVGHGPSLRVESRLPGGDVNPYLAIAALVAARPPRRRRRAPAAARRSRATPTAPTRRRMPTTLAEATDLFDRSAVARAAFGDEVVDHYVHAARVELGGVRAVGHRLGARPGIRAPVSTAVELVNPATEARSSEPSSSSTVDEADAAIERARRRGAGVA